MANIQFMSIIDFLNPKLLKIPRKKGHSRIIGLSCICTCTCVHARIRMHMQKCYAFPACTCICVHVDTWAPAHARRPASRIACKGLGFGSSSAWPSSQPPFGAQNRSQQSHQPPSPPDLQIASDFWPEGGLRGVLVSCNSDLVPRSSNPGLEPPKPRSC